MSLIERCGICGTETLDGGFPHSCPEPQSKPLAPQPVSGDVLAAADQLAEVVNEFAEKDSDDEHYILYRRLREIERKIHAALNSQPEEPEGVVLDADDRNLLSEILDDAVNDARDTAESATVDHTPAFEALREKLLPLITPIKERGE